MGGGLAAGLSRARGRCVIGNAAVGQFQLDVFGEVAAALIRTPQAKDDIRVSASALQAALIDHLCDVWRQPDKGIWETRGSPKHFTHSKVMAWVALDRAIRYHERFDGGGDLAAMEEESRAHPPRSLREGLQQAAEQLRAIVRVNANWTLPVCASC